MFFWEGFLLGLAISIPVGPMSFVCINKTLSSGKMHGFIAGLGIATADSFYAAIAAFGMTALSSLLMEHQFWLNVIGGIFLAFIGTKAIFKKTEDLKFQKLKQKDGMGFIRSYFTTLVITVSSPATIFLFISVFTIMGVDLSGGDKSFFSASVAVIGFFLGSILWWILLIYTAHFIGNKINYKAFNLINKISGLIIYCFSCFILLKAFNLV